MPTDVQQALMTCIQTFMGKLEDGIKDFGPDDSVVESTGSGDGEGDDIRVLGTMRAARERNGLEETIAQLRAELLDVRDENKTLRLHQRDTTAQLRQHQAAASSADTATSFAQLDGSYADYEYVGCTPHLPYFEWICFCSTWRGD